MGNNWKNMTQAFSGIDNRRQKYILIAYGIKKGKKRAKKGQKMTKIFFLRPGYKGYPLSKPRPKFLYQGTPYRPGGCI